MQKMIDFLSHFHNVPTDILVQYTSHYKEIFFPKKTIMTAPGETEGYMYFVAEGIQKSYYLDGDKTHVIAFTYPPSFTGIPESFFMQEPSRYYLETITASKLYRISYADHQRLLEEYREIETLFRKATEIFLSGLLHRYHELMALDMETRFKSFVTRSPHLLTMVAQKDIASYLKIDPTNFSKLMNSVKI